MHKGIVTALKSNIGRKDFQNASVIGFEKLNISAKFLNPINCVSSGKYGSYFINENAKPITKGMKWKKMNIKKNGAIIAIASPASRSFAFFCSAFFCSKLASIFHPHYQLKKSSTLFISFSLSLIAASSLMSL